MTLSADEVIHEMIVEFDEPTREWRRLVGEVFGTFLLVLVAAGAPMVDHVVPGSVSRTAAVVAPGIMVAAIILFMGKVSGAHLNPAVTVAFALRADFPWKRVPGYLVAQLAGALAAAALLQESLHVSAFLGGSHPGPHVATGTALLFETVLTLGLVSVILGTASGAQEVGLFGALGVGGYVALAGLWASPISGASMNPVRTLGPALVAWHFADWWVYLCGPLLGALLAVGVAWLLRGPGGGKSGSFAAQGVIAPEVLRPDKA